MRSSDFHLEAVHEMKILFFNEKPRMRKPFQNLPSSKIHLFRDTIAQKSRRFHSNKHQFLFHDRHISQTRILNKLKVTTYFISTDFTEHCIHLHLHPIWLLDFYEFIPLRVQREIPASSTLKNTFRRPYVGFNTNSSETCDVIFRMQKLEYLNNNNARAAKNKFADSKFFSVHLRIFRGISSFKV